MKRVSCIVVFAAALGGCTLDVCAEHPPAFELEITVDDDVTESVRSLAVDVRWREERFRRHYVVGTALDDGLTSIGVELDPRPTDELDITVRVRGLATEEPTSAVVAEDEERFELSPDGCNLFPVEIDVIEAER